jgi:hypothetical protein
MIFDCAPFRGVRTVPTPIARQSRKKKAARRFFLYDSAPEKPPTHREGRDRQSAERNDHIIAPQFTRFSRICQATGERFYR